MASDVQLSKRPIHRSAALVYRVNSRRIEFLFVSSASDPTRLVLPGGRLDRDETPQRAAARETREESGIRVAIRQTLGCYSHRKRSGAKLRTALFLATMLAETTPAEKRRRVWLSPQQLRRRAICLPNKALRLIEAAHAQLTQAIAA